MLEVGLGGRGDATNVIDPPAACAITSISLDHRELLGPTVEIIAGEKAGIMKPGVPVAIGAQPDEVRRVLLDHAAATRRAGPAARPGLGHRRRHAAACATPTPPAPRRCRRPSLPGLFQLDNAGIAIAALRAAALPHDPCRASPAPSGPPGCNACTAASRAASAAGLGALAGRRPQSRRRCGAGGASAGLGATGPIHLVVGMKQAKDSAEFLRPLLPLAATRLGGARSRTSTPRCRSRRSSPPPAASPGPARASPMRCAPLPRATGPARVLICGSLYLAGEILKLDL